METTVLGALMRHDRRICPRFIQRTNEKGFVFNMSNHPVSSIQQHVLKVTALAWGLSVPVTRLAQRANASAQQLAHRASVERAAARRSASRHVLGFAISY